MVQESRGVAVIEEGPAPPVVQQVEPLVVTREYIDQTTKSLELLRQMVREALKRDVDYGQVPGTGDFLWDPGASQIIGAFNCYAGHRRILSLVDDGQKISAVVEVPIISRLNNNEVGSGIGASSTQESKHKYRWEEKPEDWGYDADDIKKFKRKEEDGRVKYRVPNPEHGELLNVVIKQASKRAEVDAAEGLPGVGSALRELFSRKKGKLDRHAPVKQSAASRETDPKWTKFWTEVRALDLPDEAHVMLRVGSMKEWLAQGRSLDLAIKTLALMKEGSTLEEASSRAIEQSRNYIGWNKITPDHVRDYDALEKVIERLTGRNPVDIYFHFGASCRGDMSITAWEAFQYLKESWATIPHKTEL